MMKFEELAEAWLEDYQKSVKHKTYINAKQAIERHLYPHFAGIAIIFYTMILTVVRLS